MLTGGQSVVRALEAENVTHVFGLIGSATLELFDALYDSSTIRFIGVHDERTGTHMADGFARASGSPGIIVAGQNGPGATNLVTGLAQAKAAFSPVISIAGSLSTEHVYRDAFQEVDQQALFAPVTKRTWTVTRASRLPEMFREAFRHAMTPRCGPVAVNLPRDVLSESSEYDESQRPEAYRVQGIPLASDRDIGMIVELLRNASRPVIVTGGGIKHAGSEAVCELAECLDAPIATAPGHGDVIPFDCHLNAGQMGPRGNPVASDLVRGADVILALGTRLGFNSTFFSYDNINAGARIIQVELEPTAIGRYFPVALGVWADAASAARQIRQAWDKAGLRSGATDWAERFKRHRKVYLMNRDAGQLDDSPRIQPGSVFRALRSVLPRDAAITLDAGTLCLQATDALNYWRTPSLFSPLDFGLVGFSFACGLGVKLAMPDRPVVSLMGDGGFGMTLSELSTAVKYGINTTTIVLNNRCWGAEKAYQRDFFNGRYIGADIASPPFDKVAELYGAAGFAVDRIQDLGEAVSSALQCGKPAVIDVAVDPDALYSFRRDSFVHRGG